jgi:AcrR family transcriptional regulator
MRVETFDDDGRGDMVGAVAGAVKPTVAAGAAERADAQAERRSRIRKVAAELAEGGGYDAVHMREVARRADVALGTLYRYFPSKDHLLLDLWADLWDVDGPFDADHSDPVSTPADRVVALLSRGTERMQASPLLTAASLRAFLATDPSVAEGVRGVREVVTSRFVQALRGDDDGAVGGRPTTGSDGWLSWEELVARILQYMWFGSLASWLNGAEPPEQVARDMEQAARLVVATR